MVPKRHRKKKYNKCSILKFWNFNLHLVTWPGRQEWWLALFQGREKFLKQLGQNRWEPAEPLSQQMMLVDFHAPFLVGSAFFPKVLGLKQPPAGSRSQWFGSPIETHAKTVQEINKIKRHHEDSWYSLQAKGRKEEKFLFKVELRFERRTNDKTRCILPQQPTGLLLATTVAPFCF